VSQVTKRFLTPEEIAAHAMDTFTPEVNLPSLNQAVEAVMAKAIRDAVHQERESCARAVRLTMDGYRDPATRAALIVAEHAIRCREQATGPVPTVGDTTCAHSGRPGPIPNSL
jgi:hypothetical protein